MGYNDNGVVKVDEEIFQPADGFQIQMVGGLIQQQDVRIAEQSLGQEYFNLLRTV